MSGLWQRYVRSVWENLTASWIVPFACTLGVGLTILLTQEQKSNVVLTLLRLDGLALLLYYGFRWRKDIASLRHRLNKRGPSRSSLQEPSDLRERRLSPLIGALAAMVLLVVFASWLRLS